MIIVVSKKNAFRHLPIAGTDLTVPPSFTHQQPHTSTTSASSLAPSEVSKDLAGTVRRCLPASCARGDSQTMCFCLQREQPSERDSWQYICLPATLHRHTHRDFSRQLPPPRQTINLAVLAFLTLRARHLSIHPRVLHDPVTSPSCQTSHVSTGPSSKAPATFCRSTKPKTTWKRSKTSAVS